MPLTHAVLLINKAPLWSMNEMMQGINWGLNQKGITTDLIITEENGEGIDRFIQTLSSKSPEDTFILDMNGRMQMAPLYHFPRFSYMTDHPFAAIERLQKLPPKALFSYVDRTDIDFIKALGIPNPAHFVPHGGPAPQENPIAIKDREIDTLFIGRLEVSPRLDDLLAQFGESPKAVVDIVHQAAVLSSQGTALFEAFLTACQNNNVAPNEIGLSGIQTILRVVSHYSEAKGRHDAITRIAEHRPVTLVGSVSEDFFATVPENVDFLGPRPYQDALTMMQSAKIVLNVVPVFPDGSHERIWDAMACGAAVLSDPSRFISEDFTHGENFLFLPKVAKDYAQFAELNDQALQGLVDQAAPIYRAKHTWQERAGRILRALADA